MLNDKSIQRLKIAAKPKKYADGGGLFLYVAASGAKLWRMAYRFEGKAKLLSFGENPLVSLHVARQCREEAKELLAQGIDPAAHKKAAKAVKTAKEECSFQSVALEWYERQMLHCGAHYRTFLMTQMRTGFFPTLGDRPIAEIDAADIAAALIPFTQEAKLRGGRRLMEICGQIFRYAVETGRSTVDWTAALPPALQPKVTMYRAAALDAGKIGQIMLNLEHHAGYFPVACALRLVPLLCVRSTELRCAAWSEFDFSRKLWVIPAERMWTQHTHVVPLSRQAIGILKELKTYSGSGPLLFPGIRNREKPIDMSTITVSLRRRGYGNIKLSFDGFRSLSAYLLSRIGYDNKLISVQLGQIGRGHTRKNFDTFQHITERKAMMQAFADYLYAHRDKELASRMKKEMSHAE